ncbi:MAG: ATP-binding protein [Bacteroidetes bacterium]|nr:ATP-binding protein [Bacteroidota bacterium]
MNEVIVNSLSYIRSRSSSRVNFSLSNGSNRDLYAPLRYSTFEWVIENIFKNAVDAMEGEVSITVSITDPQQFVYIDICDTGKGIPKSKFKKPYLSRVIPPRAVGGDWDYRFQERIVEEYHGGAYFVKRGSEMNKGTTFRIVLPK